MKRPLALVGFCYLLTLAAAVFVGSGWALPLACICLGLFIAALFIPSARAGGVFPLAFLTMSLAFGSFSVYTQSAVLPAQALADKDAVIEGVVCELPYQAYNRTYYTVKVTDCSLPGAPKNMKIRLSCQNALNVEPYSRITGKVHLFLPSGGEGYSSRSYYASKGIMLFSYLYEYENVRITPPTDKPPYYYALKLRSSLLKSVREMLPPEQAALVNGVVFGDVTSLSDEVSNDFRTIGISHILSVSGLHMSTMAELILMLLLFLRVPKKLSAPFAACGVLAFMAITCFVPSVVRSGVMCLLYLLGMMLSRQADSLTSLGVSVLLIALVNPYAAADIGLLLSFLATLGLILYSNNITTYLNEKCSKIKRGKRLVHGVNGALATTFAAMFFTLPIGIVSFGSVSLIAPLANVLELVPSTVMMNFAAIGAVMNLIAPQSYLAMPFALVSGLLAEYMQKSAHWLAQIPYASISASYGFVLIWLAGTMLLAALTLLMGNSRRLRRVTALLSCILLLFGIFSYRLSMRDVTRVAVLDVGSAESIVVTKNGRAAVIGSGGFSSSSVSRYLKAQGITKLDYIQLITQEREESVNCAELIDQFTPARFVMRESDYIDGFLQVSLPHVQKADFYTNAAQTKLWDDITLDTVSCGSGSAVRLIVNTISVLILPSGAEPDQLPPEWLNSDFLVADSVPKNQAGWNPVVTVFSLDEQDLNAELAKVRNLNPILTAGNGNIVLAVKGDQTVQIRRE